MQNIPWDDNIVTSLEILSCLNKLNQTNRGSDHKGLKVPYDTFYMSDLPEHVDISIDYVKWCTEEPPFRVSINSYGLSFVSLLNHSDFI